MSKFKVGDVVRKKNNIFSENKKVVVAREHHYELEGGDGFWEDDELELVSKSSTPIRNTIITDIKSKEQHRRVQEKLFEMGFKENDSDNSFNERWPVIKIYYDNLWGTYADNEPNWPHITASEFLGEEAVDKNPRISINYKTGEMSFNSIIINTPNEPCVGGIKKVMSNIMSCGEGCFNEIVGFAKNLVLSADEKLLRKYGLHDSCGDATAAARDLVLVKLIKDNEPYLLEIAKAKQEEDKANK